MSEPKTSKKTGGIMETVMTWSTFALAVLTFAILLIAIINYHKFVQNVDLIRQSIEKQTKALQLQSNSVTLQEKNIYLTHKPIVFVKIPPTRSDANSNPLKDTFFLTNTGKLPAKNVAVSIIINQVVGGMIGIDNSQDIPILEQITLYPGVDLAFWIQEKIRIGGDVSKAEIIFIIKYEGQGIEGEMTEKMKFIYTKDITKWLHVGPKYDIFSKERKKYQERLRELNRSGTGSK